jgi:hypothetical protein
MAISFHPMLQQNDPDIEDSVHDNLNLDSTSTSTGRRNPTSHDSLNLAVQVPVRRDPPSHDSLNLDSTSTSGIESFSVKLLAFHFPQFHEFELNDRLWGKGFTEWNNVVRVLFNHAGTETIRPAASIGYYNLLSTDTRRRQANQARENGVHGFIYHIYWFDGVPVMEAPLKAMLRDGEPNLPFMFNWANEPWTSNWDGGNTGGLVQQVGLCCQGCTFIS